MHSSKLEPSTSPSKPFARRAARTGGVVRARCWWALFAFSLTLMGRVQAARAEQPPWLEELRRGGLVLFLRHPATQPDQADTDPLHLENVQAQRQLTEAGRQQAKALGAALRALHVPFEKVVASLFKRAQDTAKLLDVGAVQGSLDVSEGGLVVTPRENQRRAAALRQLLGTIPPAGKNLLIVSHRPNLQDAAGKDFGDLAEAEIAIFRPRGEGKFELVARVAPPERWTQWAGEVRAVRR